GLTALVRRAFAGERYHSDAESVQRLAYVKGLIGNERTQRIDEQACLVTSEGTQGRMHLKRQRLTPPCSHNAQHRAIRPPVIKDGALCVVQRLLPDDRTHHFSLERAGILGCLALPRRTVCGARSLIGFDILGLQRAIGTKFSVGGSV